MATACASKIMVVLLFVSLGLLRSVLSFSIYTLKDTQTSKSLKSAFFKERDTESVDAINIPLLRRNAAEISHSFVTKEFNPAWFAKNNHLQTITGVFSREDSAYFPPTGNQILKKFEWDDRERVETHDGDFFFVDWKFCASDDRVGRPSTEAPVVLICHGLQSNSDSLLVKDMAIAFNNVGMDTACINFRGCIGEMNKNPLGYHLSFTDDLKFMVERVAGRRPGAPIYLSGFSLGANVVTKYLSDMGTDVLNYNICGAAVNAIPFDLVAIQPNLNEPGISKSLYGDMLLQSLTDRTLDSMKSCRYPFTEEDLLQCKNVKDYDELVVCSTYDFEDADDYHRKSSTFDILHKVMVPELAIQALDDPFFQGQANPQNDPEQPLRIQYTKYGGHCGFIHHSEDLQGRGETSWLPTELARFLKFVDDARVESAFQANSGRKHFLLSDTKLKDKELHTTRSSEKEERRILASRISHEFRCRDFSPAWWSRNAHLQTIMGTLFREETMYSQSIRDIIQPWRGKKPGGIKSFVWDERQRVETPDGDFFDVDWKFCGSDEVVLRSDGTPLVLICHGLQSNSDSPLVKDMAMAFNNIGLDAACINFRGCSGVINRTPTGYHLGFTDDLKQMIEQVNTEYPEKRIYLSGFSLGANVVTKCLAEMGDNAYEHNIYGAAVNAVPFDMTKSNLNLNEDGITKSIYGERLLRSMIERIEDSYDSIEFAFAKQKAQECKTIMDMENLVIAPVFGFDDAWDYYEKCSTKGMLDKVSVPQFVIQAKDDPFFQGQENPSNNIRRPLRIHYTENGGHCGYVFHSMREGNYKTSWMPSELARFVSHIEENFKT